MHNYIEDLLFKTGPLAPFAGLAVSLTTVNTILQTVSLSIGILIGLCSLWVIIKKIKAEK